MFYFTCMFACVHKHMARHTRRSEDPGGSWFSSSTMCVLGIELRGQAGWCQAFQRPGHFVLLILWTCQLTNPLKYSKTACDVCVRRVCVPQHTCGGQRATLWSRSSPSTLMWPVEIDFGLPGWGAVTWGAASLARFFTHAECFPF